MTLSSDQSTKNLDYYINCFSKLKVYKHRSGEALNKPILLLCILELISQKVIQENIIHISDELIVLFNQYWILLTNKKPKNSDFALPFFHLKNHDPKFWYLVFSDDYDGGRPQTIPKLKKDVQYAKLDDELFHILMDNLSRELLMSHLISIWFSSNEKQLEEVLSISQNIENISNIESLEDLQSSEKKPRISLKKSLVRDVFFRKSIVHLYNYRCALCSLKVNHSVTQSIVDGAHIKPFSEFYDNSLGNGLSLCKNHHWAFDAGLFTINLEYHVIVSSNFEEESPHSKPLKEFQGKSIILPSFQQYYPKQESLEWHRFYKFKR